MERKGVIFSVAISLVIGLGVGSIFLPMGIHTNTVTNAYTVTHTYSASETSTAWFALVGQSNQSSASVTTYYMVCIITWVYGFSDTMPGTTYSHPTTWFNPMGTITSTSFSATTSSAQPGQVVTVLGTNNTCTYISTLPLP